ncbi:tetratricopeptide repeat protein [Anaerolineales bacterium HSG6]|nr:tetratricopeptide repeat protein [Anaerolineales bacterium HSG6]
MDLITFGKQLREYRRAIKLSGVDLAEALVELTKNDFDAPVKPLTGNQLLKWERAYQNRRPSQLYMRGLVQLFAKYNLFNLPEAITWSKQAGIHFLDSDLEDYFPCQEMRLSLEAIENFDVSLSSEADKVYHRRQVIRALLTEAITEARRKNNRQQEVTLGIELAKLYQQHGDYQRSIRVYQQLIGTSERLDDKGFLTARAKNNLAYLFTETDEKLWPMAEKLCRTALRTFTQLGDTDKLAHTYNHLGVLYTRWQRYDSVDQNLSQARKFWQARNDTPNLLGALINHSLYHIETQNHSETVSYLTDAEQLSLQSRKQPMLGTIYMNLGITHRRQNDLDQAKSYLKQAETILTDQHSLSSLAQVRSNLGLLLLNQHQWVEAKLYMTSALQLWQCLNNFYGVEKVKTHLTLWEKEKTGLIHDLARTGDVSGVL